MLYQMAPVSVGEVLGWIVGGIATLMNYRIKLEVKNELDTLRKEFGSTFVQAPLASEQRANIIHRLEVAEKENASNRLRIHDISGEIMSKITGQIFEMNNRLTDKARRMGAYEEHQKHQDGQRNELIKDVERHNDQLSEIQRRLGDIERRHHEIDKR